MLAPAGSGRFEAAFAVACVGAVVPLWLIAFPPLQDWPQHVATVRVLNDFRDPTLGMVGSVEVDLFRTQYLAVYLVACALARVFGPFVACKLVLSLSIVATPYATRSLLGSLGSDRRHALWCLPLTYNAHVLLGFLNFVAAIPLALFTIALAARYRAARSPARGVLLAVSLVVLFYTHVVLFGFGALGALALLAELAPWRRIASGLAPFVPASFCVASWLRASPAGSSTLAAVEGAARGATLGGTRFDPFEKTLREVPEWLTDVLPGDLDRVFLLTWCALFVLAALFAREKRAGSPAALRLRAAMLAPLAAVAAFVMPYQHEWIWPIAGRFPYLACLFAPLLLSPMRPRAGAVVAGALALLALAHVGQNAAAFRAYDDEACGARAAIRRIPTGARVVGLIYDVDSRHVGQHPFMHYVAYSQAAHGGIVEFSFAETPSSPFRYLPTVPAVNLGFGWAPQLSNPYQLASYFEYALVRGSHPHLRSVARFYERTHQEGDWSLWRRRAPAVRPL